MSIKRILISDPVSQKGFEDLQAIDLFEVVDGSSWELPKLQEEIKNFHGLVIRSSTKCNQELLDAASSLEVVVRAGTGVDNIDVAYADKKNVLVMNTPGTNAQAAAELTMGLMLSMVRDIPKAVSSIQEGRWDRKKFVGTELHQKTLGVIGMGNIGQRVAMIAHGFGMHVVGFDPRESIEFQNAFSVEMVGLDILQMRSNFITLHAALNDQTRGMINKDFIAKMKPGSYLVNCARAELINTTDLLEALESGHLAGAAMDVLDQEPPEKGHPLVSHPKIVVTPHIGASTKEAQENVMIQVTRQLKDYFEIGTISNQVK